MLNAMIDHYPFRRKRFGVERPDEDILEIGFHLHLLINYKHSYYIHEIE